VQGKIAGARAPWIHRRSTLLARARAFALRSLRVCRRIHRTASRSRQASAPEGLLPIPDYGGDLWSRSRLTGDWRGLRTHLADKGVQIDVDFTQYVQGLAAGGRRSRTEYGGHADYIVRMDLMRARINFAGRYGAFALLCPVGRWRPGGR